MLKSLDALSKTLAIDFGTHTTRVWEKSAGLVAEYPSFLAVDTTSEKILAFGADAQEMAGRVAANVKVFRPVQEGQVWDVNVAKAFLQTALRHIVGRSFFNPTVLVSIPATLRPAVEDETVQLGYALGAREVLTVAQPLAAAIGAGMPVADASGGFLLQIGAGRVEVGVVSLGTLVGVEGTVKGGDWFERLVISTVKNSKQVVVSVETARMLIHKLASVSGSSKKTLLVTGKSQQSGAPVEVEISSADLREPSLHMAREYVQLAKKLLTKVPTELTVDIVDKGLLLSGGGALLAGLEEFLVPELGVPVSVVDDPERAVIRGMGTITEHLDEFRRSLGYEG